MLVFNVFLLDREKHSMRLATFLLLLAWALAVFKATPLQGVEEEAVFTPTLVQGVDEEAVFTPTLVQEVEKEEASTGKVICISLFTHVIYVCITFLQEIDIF